MLGFRYLRFDAMDYVIHYRNGQVVREGRGLAFIYFAPQASIVAIPAGSRDLPFIFEERTADFQPVTLQGQLTYKVEDPRRLASQLDFTVDAAKQYRKDDFEKLPQRLVNEAQTAAAGQIQRLDLRSALRNLPAIETALQQHLQASPVLEMLGLQVLGVQVLALRPAPDMARALEAATREALQQEADHAVYERRNFALEQERRLRESELSTEIAIEEKQKQIAEKRMETEAVKQENAHRLRQMELRSGIELEKERRELIGLEAENEKIHADTRRYVSEAALAPFAGLDWKTLLALQGGQLDSSGQIALAFRELAENAQRIGNLNIGPDLLDTLMRR